MNQRTQDRSIAFPASVPLLLVLTTLLLQSISAAQNNSTLVSGGSAAFNPPHEESIRPISAVGNQDIGCSRGLGNRYSLQEQLEMGRFYAQQVEATSKLISDTVIAEYVNRVGQTLAQHSGKHVQLSVKIIDTEEVNAFSLPGGFVFVDSGLVLAADNEAELAGVIAHEMAHVVACHATQEMAREQLTNLTSMPLIFRLLFRHALRNTVYSNPTTSFESEADSRAVEYLYKAGYDPDALSSFLEKAGISEKQSRGTRANALESHPRIAGRIERAQQEINKLPPYASEYKLDTSEFQEIKNRLSKLESDRKVDENQSVPGPAASATDQCSELAPM